MNYDASTPLGSTIGASARWRRQGHRGGVLWFTGLSGSGKSTLAQALEQTLFASGWQAFVLDGDNLRHGLNADLGFSDADRGENIRRVTEVSGLFAEAGMIAISAFISPFRADRIAARQRIGDGFHEIYLSASLEVCELRDPKGLYGKARRGEITDFTGISSLYEKPKSPDLNINTGVENLAGSLKRLADYAKNVFVEPT